MEENDEFEGDHLSTTTSFSQLLFADDAVDLDVDQTLRHSPIFSLDKPPRMLCFGNHQNEGDSLLSEITGTPKKSVLTSPESSSPSSCNHSSSHFSSLSKSNKKRNVSGQELVRCTDSISTKTTTTAASKKSRKMNKTENPTSTGHAKKNPRKEKLGERIAALQQLVSPFGKTDTASVLHEAMGYIRFLHDQVQVLCSPYLLQRLPSSPHRPHHQPGEEAKTDLKSMGLCLIPVECTVHVANSNGADFWSPAMVDEKNNNNVSSSKKQ
ncbi:hypothetical protein L6164_032069 [Bauhinia variegata]|uniref:Uncharacterized protein n=1 Tax=Bauhinia variegata TaxID=167791 RepID=A0ACB9KMH0_BAUVA|nr:hypothetical protein L6164_032069 [Bauhinia variegata]